MSGLYRRTREVVVRSTNLTAETQTLVGQGANQLGLSIVRTGISPVSSEWATQVGALRPSRQPSTPT